jgi:hypothetical protein
MNRHQLRTIALKTIDNSWQFDFLDCNYRNTSFGMNANALPRTDLLVQRLQKVGWFNIDLDANVPPTVAKQQLATLRQMVLKKVNQQCNDAFEGSLFSYLFYDRMHMPDVVTPIRIARDLKEVYGDFGIIEALLNKPTDVSKAHRQQMCLSAAWDLL